MGGGGGGRGSLGDTRGLEERAKELLKQAEGKANVFISFAFEDVDEVNLLRAQAKNDNSDVAFNDRSVREPYDSERAEYIRLKLRERINQCSTTIVYLSKDTARSDWVRYEVETSLDLGKRVLAVHSGDTAPAVPSFITKNNIEVLPWSKLAETLRQR